MKQLIIVLDSSVSSTGSQVGPAACFWLAYAYEPTADKHPISLKLALGERYKNGVLMEAAKLKPNRSGAIYNSVDGPTKIFYDGIIRALESCFYLIQKEKITEILVLGDCEHALKQINGKVGVLKMAPMYNQVKKWEADYNTKNIKVHYSYIKESDFSLYKKTDGICKEIRNRIQNAF